MFNLIGYRDNTDATKVHFYVKPTNNVYFTPTVRISGTGAIARYTSPPSSPVDEDYTYSSATTYNHGLKAGSIHLNDNNNLNFGSSDDVRLYFDGTDSLYITATNGTADKLKTNANYTAIMQANGQQLITALANDAVIINEDSNNHDFRVESDGNANMLFVDGGNSTVTVGSSISNAGAAFLVDYNNTSKFMMGGAGAGISNNVYYNGSAWKSINNSVGGSILQMGTDGSFAFRRGTAAATPSMTYSAYIDGNGNTGLGTTTPANYSNRTTLAVNGVWGGQIDLELGETVRSSWKLDTSQNVYFGTGANDTRLFLQVNDTNIAEFTSSNIIFNEAGNDVDFRVESDGSQHAFFVDGGTNNIGIQTATNWALTGGGSASSSSGVSIDMSYDGTIYAGSAYWAGGLKTGTGFFSDASGDRYKRSSRQVTQIRQSSQGADIKFRSQTSGNAGAVISWHEMADFGRDAVVFNNGGLDQDFRVASDNNANMLFVDAGSEQVKIGSSNVGTYGCLEVKNSDGRHGTGQKSWSIISGTSHPSKSVDGVMAFNTTSAGNQLSIPIVSQGNQHRPCLVELTFVTGEYNMSGSVKAGFVRFAFQSLTSIGSLAVLETQGNVASVSSSGMNLLINFTSAYTSGQSNHEGVMCYYRIMNEQPQYVKMWDATLN